MTLSLCVYLRGVWRQVRVGLVSQAAGDRARGHSLQLHKGTRLDIRKNFFTGRLDIGTGFPGKWWSHHPWKHLRKDWMWHLVLWAS